MTADRRALTLNIDEAKFLEAVDREGDHEIGAGSASAIDRAALVEKVADVIAKAWDEHGRVIDAATAAISLIRAEVLEEAARECERIAREEYGMEGLHEFGECAAAIRALKDKA